MTGDTVPPANLRNEYAADLGLTETNLAGDWYTQFDRWFTEAVAAGLPEPNAMVLGIADAAGRPSARTVLLKGYGPDGFVLFTNYGSRKGTELAASPYASLVFPWFVLERQVAVTGRVERLDRAALDAAYRAMAERFVDGAPIPAPPHWGGFRIRPDEVEFWQGQASRLHDRLRFRVTDGGDWVVERLAP